MIGKCRRLEEVNLNVTTEPVEDQSRIAESRPPASLNKPASNGALPPKPLQPRQLMVVDLAGRQRPVSGKSRIGRSVLIRHSGT